MKLGEISNRSKKTTYVKSGNNNNNKRKKNKTKTAKQYTPLKTTIKIRHQTIRVQLLRQVVFENTCIKKVCSYFNIQP